METGIIPPNLHYSRPREGFKALTDGRLKVVTELTPWNGGLMGINSFGFGGANCHIILKSNSKKKINNGAPNDDLPRLVAVSGRTEDSVNVFLDDIKKHPIDVEYIRLLHDIHSDDIQGHLYRGYIIVGSKTAEQCPREIENYLGTVRPIWFVFSGMGSQWPGMGIELMRFPIFAEAIKKCDALLRPRGVDIINILTNKDKTIFDNILHSFVGIAAVQIGLVDLLTSIGIVPDNIIGHSVGELGCAYADGCFTAEQMILSAYSRGLASIETELPYGSMAAVGLGYEDIKNMCPPDIEVACHNASDSSTISGPAESMKEFVAQLQAKQIFAREVACSNIPYHSRYIAPAGPKLLAYLTEVIPEPKPRSQKWVSTSVPRNQWSTASAKLSSAEYHTNNLLSPVLFEETARMIPKDAVTIEIAPHGLLQAILRRSLGSGVTNIALTQRGHKDNVDVVLQAIGKLYNTGYQPNLANLYPPVEYPVSRGTPMISPSVRWEHSDDWYVTAYKSQKKIASGEKNITLSTDDENFEYMRDYVIDGKNLVPAMGYLAMVWEIMGTLHSEVYSELSVVFEDVIFKRAIHIPKESDVQLTLMVQRGTGRFEVTEGDTTVATGFVRVVKNPAQEKIPVKMLPEDDEEEIMNTEDIYKELRLRGYEYSGAFRSLKSASLSRKKGHISWMCNWVTFIDNMLQMMILGLDTKDLYIPTKIRKMVIDSKLHQQEIQNMDSENKQLPVHVYKDLDTIISGGIEIRGFRGTIIPRELSINDSVLEEYKFIAYRDKAHVSLKEAIRLSTQIAIECHQATHVKTIELIDDSDNVTTDKLASPMLTEILNDLPLIQPKVQLSAPSNRFDDFLLTNVTSVNINEVYKEDNVLLAVGIELLSKNKTHQLEQILSKLRNGGFVLTRERSFKLENLSTLSKNGLDVILEKSTGEEIIVLLKKKEQLVKRTEVIHVNNNEFTWLKKLNSFMNEKNEITDMRIILVSEGELESGLLGFVNCLRKEVGGEMIRCVLIQDTEAPKFSLRDPLYLEQLQLNLPINVLKPQKIWGSYRYQPLSSFQPKPVRHAYVDEMIPGDLSSLRWIEGPIRPDAKQKDLVHVAYSSLNLKDIMFATRELVLDTNSLNNRFDKCLFGFEYAGVDTAGHRVMGFGCRRGISNIIEPDRDFCWNVPDNWSLEDAATVPSVYALCYNGLYQRAEMKKGDKLLIHCGTGGIGQAAIHLALHEGCEVFTTAGTPEKRKLIREMFPSIPDDHIGNSRDLTFERLVLQQTKGKGVDIVLNLLGDEQFQASIRCLGQGGRFLEMGKFDITSDNSLGMMIFLKEVSVHGVMINNLFAMTEEYKKDLHDIVNKGLKNGAVKPLVRKVFEKEELETAFRYMTTGEHVGKVLLKICDEKKILEKKPILADPRYYCDSGKTYLILGGLGGFGLELADWLVLRGAKNLVLTSRTGIKNGYQRMKVELWKSYGVNVLIITGADASSRKDCEFILNSAEKQGPVDAVFNLAMVLKDGVCKNQTPESFEESFRAKARATKMLDELSRKLCPQLRQFVVFSSISSGKGNAGQTNYGMANSVMERICERRVADGLPGLAIQWGAISEVGLIADNRERAIDGILQQKVSSCLEKLEIFLLQDRPVVSSMVVAKKHVGTGAINIVDIVANIIGVKDLNTVAQDIPLTELGMDSTMAVKIKQALERECDIFFTAQDMANLNFAKLMEMRDRDLERQKADRQKGDDAAELSGIQLLIRMSNNEELFTDTCVELQTKMNPRRLKTFLLPGIQGSGHIFNPLASKIKPITIALQYGITNANMSIPEYADHLLRHILPTAEEQRGFAIIGYSFGSLIAIELARRLEKQGLNGRVVLIDGAPELLKAMVEQFIPFTTEEELQNNILLAIMDSIQTALSGNLLLELEKCTTWEEKLDLLLSHIPDNKMSLSIKTQKALCTTMYMHILALRRYDLSALEQIRSPITLLKPTVPSISMTEEDYGLHKITRDKVEVYYAEGNHVTMLDDDKVVMAINGEPLIDPEEFKKLLEEDRPFGYEETKKKRTRV